MEQVRPRAKKAAAGDTPAALWAYFVAQCRANMHVVLTMSPVGDAFRTRLRMFPSLVNCCTIDWFSVWPADALRSVADRFLRDVEMDSAAVRAGVMQMCQHFHLSVRSLSERFRAEAGRAVYVTPTSYLELITTYKTLLGSTRTQARGRRRNPSTEPPAGPPGHCSPTRRRRDAAPRARRRWRACASATRWGWTSC